MAIEVVGWAAVAPRADTTFARNPKIPHADDLDVWSVWCFRVRPGHRRSGIDHDLPRGAVEHARDNGARADRVVDLAHVQYLYGVQTLRELNKDARRTEVLRAARDLVAEGGVDALTMRAVAERAHVSVPTIYNLIGHRAQVLAALMDAGGAQLDDLLDGSSDTDPTTSLVEASEALAAVVAPNADVVAAVLADGIGGPLGDDGLFGRFRHVVLETLTDACETGRLDRPAHPDLLTERCMALAAGAVISWATVHRDEDRLRDDLVHGSLLVLAAHVTDDERPRVRRELDRRARRLTDSRARPSRPGSRRPSSVAR